MSLPLLTELAVFRILNDLLQGELKNIRDFGSEIPDFTKNAVFQDNPWHIDSIEILELAAAVNEFFHLHKTGLEDNLLRHKSMKEWVEIVSFSWQNHPEEITFRTSGSTGNPQPFIHKMDSLMQETAEIAGLFENIKRIISFVPAHHIYGFIFTILLPEHKGIKVIDCESAGIGILLKRLEPGDLLVSFPAHWAYLERSTPCWPEGIRGVSSTGPASPELLWRLLNKGLDGVTEIYGSSERGSIGYRHKPERSYEIFSFLKRSKSQTNGEYFLIRNLPNGNRKEFFADDLLKWDNSEEFRVLQRKDGAVQVGGINVYPEKVADKIKEHPFVADCSVRLADKSEIPRLKAFIVTEHEITSAFRKQINQWLYQKLSAQERPVYLSFGKEIPKNCMGKNTDWDR